MIVHTRIAAVVSLLVLGLFWHTSMSSAQQVLEKNQRVVFFGDSITQAGARPKGYVTLVRNAIEKARPDDGIEIINAGISGHKVPDLIGRLDRDVISKKPDVVVIYIGINDVWHSRTGKGTPADEFKNGLEELIQRIGATGAKVILCTPSTIGEKAQGSNDLDKMLSQYAQISRDVAAETNAQLLDLQKAFFEKLKTANPDDKPKGILTTDGVHLNDAGNQFVADQMLAALAMTQGTPKPGADVEAEKKADSTLRHIVMFKFVDGLADEKIQEVVAGFDELPNQISTISGYESGTNISAENKALGFTHAFVVTFDDQAGLDAYLPHDAHQAFVKLLAGRIDKVLVFDYQN